MVRSCNVEGKMNFYTEGAESSTRLPTRPESVHDCTNSIEQIHDGVLDLTLRPAPTKYSTQTNINNEAARNDRSELLDVRTCIEKHNELHGAELDVLACDRPKSVQNCTKEGTIFNLASEAGQEHLRELNQELKALNEQGSPKLSLLHGPKQKRKRVQKLTDTVNAKKQRNVKKKIVTDLGKTIIQDSSANFVPENEAEKKADPDHENDIDKLLEEKAMKTNLTAINVKNILKYVVTNEHVLSMVQNSVQEEDDKPEDNQLPEAVYEPKLTRSKAKELIERQVTVPWPISPFKKETVATSKKIIELSFSESESSSDEEYDPEKDEQIDVDDNLNTSQTSEPESIKLTIIESPLPSGNTRNEILEMSELLDPSEESEDTIALRTRSKLPLNDTPLECIEAQFIAPDITTDMYDSECDDEEWKGFLWEFLKPLDSTSVDNVDDDANDPEYNFLAEEDIPDREDLRDDRAVKISKKEMQELVAELIEAAEDELADEDEDTMNCKPNCSSTLIHERQTEDLNTAFKCAQVETLFDVDMRLQLEEQMRKHVQLLTQMFLFSCQEPGLKLEMEMSKVLLFELYDLSAKNNSCYSRPSAFCAYNLKEAVDIVASYSLCLEGQSLPPQSSKGKHCSTINDASLMMLAQSKVFIYPEILPKQYFQPPKPYKGKFTEAEDNLLAMGLEQFISMSSSKTEHSCWSLIKEHMIPVKSVKHISIRAKNLKSNKWPENPVKYFYRTKHAPPVPRCIQPFNPNQVLPPFKQNLSILPQWLQKYITEKARMMCFPNKSLIIPIKPISSCSNAGSSKPDVHDMTIVNNKLESPASFQKVSENLYQECHSATSLAAGLGSNQGGKWSSTWKKVSPILKKYSPKRLRKTGGNLTKSLSHVKKIFPKPVLPPPKIPFYGIKVRLLPSKTNKPILLPKPSQEKLLPKLQFSQISNPVTEPKLSQLHSCDSKNLKTSCANGRDQTESAPIMKTDVANPKDVQKELTEPKENICNNIHNADNSIGVEEASVQEIPVKCSHTSDLQGSESDIEAEMFDDGEDTADDDIVDMQACDNEDDLAALMAASTTIKSIPRQRHNLIKKNKKLLRDRKDLLAMLDYDKMEGDKLKEERETAYAQAYLLKVKDVVGSHGDIFEEFLRILHEFSKSDTNVIQLYKDICKLLKDFPELCEEFVAFLLPEQARECGKFMEYLSLTKMQVFLKKLEVHFGKHPHHIQKIIKVLTQLQTQQNLSIDDVKAAIVPLLRGQQHLIEEFLQLFPDEAPSESLMTDFEELFVPGEDEEIIIDGDGFEVIDLPDVIDEYGGQYCTCSCHLSSEKPKIQNRLHHCIGCGIKFIDGRIFLQAGKTLKPCQVLYLSPDDQPIDVKATSPIILDKNAVKIQNSCSKDTTELMNRQSKSVSSASSISSLSPNLYTISDEEREARGIQEKCQSSGDVARKPNNPLLDALEHISRVNNATGPTEAVTEDAILPPDNSTNLDPSVPADFSLLRHVIYPKNRTVSFELKVQHPPTENGEDIAAIQDTSTTKAQAVMLDTQSRNEQGINVDYLAESLLICKEQEITTVNLDSTYSIINARNSIQEDARASLAVPAGNHTVTKEGQVVVLWTRELDRILLQMCQQLSPSIETFSVIASKLTKTVEEVAARFQTLMALYSQQDSPSLTKMSDQN